MVRTYGFTLWSELLKGVRTSSLAYMFAGGSGFLLTVAGVAVGTIDLSVRVLARGMRGIIEHGSCRSEECVLLFDLVLYSSMEAVP